jgi:hypothetical protein
MSWADMRVLAARLLGSEVGVIEGENLAAGERQALLRGSYPLTNG